jgi:hypothetical protein
MRKSKLTRLLLVCGTISFCLPVVLAQVALKPAPVKANAAPRADWLQTAQWGVMNHYLADWISRNQNIDMSVEEWNGLVDNFDVEALADQLQSVGAKYYQISIDQNSGYYLAPNATYDRVTGVKPSRCSRRDLVADLYTALNKRGIKLMVYLPAGAPSGDSAASTALQWQNGPHPNREFQLKWQRVIAEWSRRWGKKVAGWWFEGCYYPNAMYRSETAPNFASFAAAARAGNPEAIVSFNPGVYRRLLSMTPEEDYTAGEIDNPELLEIRRDEGGKLDGAQLQMLSHLGQRWGAGSPRFTNEQAVIFSRELWNRKGAVTWDVPVQPNGTIAPEFLEQLRAVGKAASTK